MAGLSITTGGSSFSCFENSTRQVITASLLSVKQHVTRPLEIMEREPGNIFVRTELIKLLKPVAEMPSEDVDQIYWTLVKAAKQVEQLIPHHPAMLDAVDATVSRAVAGGVVDGEGFANMLAAVEKSSNRFPFNSNLRNALWWWAISLLRTSSRPQGFV